MDAIKLLKADHDKIRKLLSDLNDTSNRAVATRRELLGKIAAELEAHTKIEEEIFYPAFKKAGDGQDDDRMFFEALEEHRAAGDLVLPDLLKTPPDSDQFGGRAKVLKELVEHHADEEEREMFPRAKKLIDNADLESLGEKMQIRKKEILQA